MVNVRLLTNIGRLWTGSEVWSNAAILTQGERIAWVGPAAELPSSIPGVIEDIVDVDQVENLGGGLVTPGLIDAHTHPVYAGNRWAELAMRSGGSSFTEIAAAGGGLTSTVTVTRGTDPWTLCNGVRARLHSWLLAGTTTIEAKTGYHLTRDGELADVRLLRSLEGEPGMPRVHVPFLAAHAIPPEFFGSRPDYVDAVGSWCADAATAGADSIDVYCDEGRFSEHEARWLLGVGRAAGLLPRLTPAVSRATARPCSPPRWAARQPTCCTARTTPTWPRWPGPGGRGAVPELGHGGRPPAAGPRAAGQGRGRRARHRPHPGRQRHHLDAAGRRPRGELLRDERHRGAARRHHRRSARAAGLGPRRDVPRPVRRHRGLGRRPRGVVRLVLRPEAAARRRGGEPVI
jgi:hypothetical protein